MSKIWEIIRATAIVIFDMVKKLVSTPKTKRESMSKAEILDFYSYLKKEKEQATANKEPWVKVIDLDIDYDNINEGAFELDWNDYFIARLMKAGYNAKTDQDMIDIWFTAINKNVAMETYAQFKADPINARKLEGNYKEYR